jgi:hypothetical protein
MSQSPGNILWRSTSSIIILPANRDVKKHSRYRQAYSRGAPGPPQNAEVVTSYKLVNYIFDWQTSHKNRIKWPIAQSTSIVISIKNWFCSHRLELDDSHIIQFRQPATMHSYSNFNNYLENKYSNATQESDISKVRDAWCMSCIEHTRTSLRSAAHIMRSKVTSTDFAATKIIPTAWSTDYVHYYYYYYYLHAGTMLQSE